MARKNFRNLWKQALNINNIYNQLLQLEYADGYESQCRFDDLKTQKILEYIKVIKINHVGGCYPGANYFAFLLQLDSMQESLYTQIQ